MYKGIFSVFVFLLVASISLVLAQTPGQGTGQALDEGELGQKVMVQAGIHMSNSGEAMMIQQQAQNQIRLEVGGVSAAFNGEMVQEKVQDKTMLFAKMSNGQNAEIKVMPNIASETALERLRLKTCSEEAGCMIELKEVGSGDEMKLAYEVQIERHSRILGIFQKKMEVRTQVSADNGEVLNVDKPWWAFIATEPAEE